MSHTPGPWRVGFLKSRVVVRDTACAVEVICGSIASPEDARLIAFAPQLLKALQEIVKIRDTSSHDNPHFYEAKAIARAAIAKAEGKP